MRRIGLIVVASLLWTSCTVGIVRREELTPVVPDTSASPFSTNVPQPAPTLHTSPLSTPELALTTMPASAETGGIELVGRFLEKASAISVQGNLAYISDDKLLTVMDVSDPIRPVIVSQVDLGMKIVKVVGNYAYAIGTGNCIGRDWGCQVILRILDVSDPSAPVQISDYPWAHRDYMYFVKIAVVGHAIYIADGDVGLLVLDISNPYAPVEVSRQEGHAWNVAIVGNYVHVLYDGSMQGHYQAYYQVLDVSTPTAPVEVSSYDITDHNYFLVRDIPVTNGYTYLVAGWRTLDIIDISNPAAPFNKVGSYVVPQITNGVDSIGDLTVANGYAYIHHRYGHDDILRIIDVSNPASPYEIGSYVVPQDTQKLNLITYLMVVDDYAYLGCGYESDLILRVIDISAPASPREVGSYNCQGTIRDLAVVDGTIYVFTTGHFLRRLTHGML